MRPRIVAGNWKMHTDATTASELAQAVVSHMGAGVDGVQVVLCPPFPFLPIVGSALHGSAVRLGAQTMHDQREGAFTGEVSGKMLRSVGCEYVIVGHSERRMMFAESDLDVSRRTTAALESGLRPIVCVGETEREREEGRTGNVVERQVRAALDGVYDFNVPGCVLAYEPIWAIGTNKSATPEEAAEVHALIRRIVAMMFGSQIAEEIPVIYGGSVKPSNAAAIFSQPGVDGGLVGGASLVAADFAEIVRSATVTASSTAD